MFCLKRARLKRPSRAISAQSQYLIAYANAEVGGVAAVIVMSPVHEGIKTGCLRNPLPHLN